MSLRAECNRIPRERHEKKSAFFCAPTPSFRIQQEVTEATEDRVPLRSLRYLLFKPPRVAHHQTPSERRCKRASAEVDDVVKPRFTTIVTTPSFFRFRCRFVGLTILAEVA